MTNKELYNYAVDICKKIIEKIDKGYIVLYNLDVLNNTICNSNNYFVFDDDNESITFCLDAFNVIDIIDHTNGLYKTQKEFIDYINETFVFIKIKHAKDLFNNPSNIQLIW